MLLTLQNDFLHLKVDTLGAQMMELWSSDLTFDYLLSALIKKLNIEGTSKDLLKTLGLLRSDGKYNNAALLLAEQNDFPGIDIIKFGLSMDDIVERETLNGISVLEQLDKAEEMFKRYYRIEKINGMVRQERYLVPFGAFRETIANALVHRTWDVNTNIRIAMYDDMIEIYSPGGLPSSLNEEEYLNGFVSYLRNPVIANVFFRLGIIEKFGTGIKRIKESYREIIHKPIVNVYENSIVTVLPSITKRINLTTAEEFVFNQFSAGKILASSDVVNLTGFGKDKVVHILNQLIEKSYLKKIGSGRGTKYVIL